jgi:hypothetical protein
LASKQRREPPESRGWLLAILFNTLLILIPVMAARTIVGAYSGGALAETPSLDAIAQTRLRMDEAFEELAPRAAARRQPDWESRVFEALEAHDYSVMRGYLLAAPQLLGRDLGRQITVRAEAEQHGSADQKIVRAALAKLPMELTARVEAAARIAASTDPAFDVEAGENVDALTVAATEAGDPDADALRPQEEIEEVAVVTASLREGEVRFRLLGSYSDLTVMTQRWLEGDRRDALIIKLTGIGLRHDYASDGRSDAVARPISVIKSAARSQRLHPNMQSYLSARADEALPDSLLAPALAEAFRELATRDARSELVREAFDLAANEEALGLLERDLQQLDRIALLTSPKAAIMALEIAESGADLRLIRLMAEAGGDRASALLQMRGREALQVAEPGIRWTRNMVIQIMLMTAAGLILFWIMLSTVRLYVRLPQPKAEPQGTS